MKKRSGVRRVIMLLAVLCAMTTLFSMQAFAKKGDESLQKRAKKIAKATGTEEVKTIHWKATVTKTKKYKPVSGKKKVQVTQGSTVTVIQRDYHAKKGVSECKTSDGKLCWIANKYLNFQSAITTGADGDYDKETKEAFVNGCTGVKPIKPGKSKVKNKLIWISLDKQRVNVFKGSAGHWKLIKEFPCSTGKVDAPTLDQTFLKFWSVRRREKVVNYGSYKNLQYYLEVYGYGIHKFPGTNGIEKIGIEPMSHSCIRLKAKAAKWMFKKKHIPDKTRIYVW